MRTIVLFFSFLIFGCSNPTEVEDVEIESNVLNNILLVENNTPHDIYYFVSEQGCLASINWAIGFDGPKIESFKKEEIPFQDIICGTDLEIGDNVVFHWRTKYMQGLSDINTIVVTL